MFPTSSSQSPTPPPSSPLLRHLSFNQDHSCFSAATPSGFRVFNSLPFRELFRRDFSPSSPFSIVSMLHHTNILALVGSANHPHFSPNDVTLWDDRQSLCIGQLSFRTPVRALLLRRDLILVALEMKLFLYAFHDFKLLRRVETVPNPKGLCALSQAADSMVIACPGLRKGQVRVEHCALKKVTFVTAHDSGISWLALTFDGKFLATASTKGTLIRVFDTYNATMLQEVRRGSNAAEIYSLAFDSNAQWLAVSSDKGTVHVFGLKIAPGMEHEKSQSSSNSDAANASSGSPLSFIKFKGVLPKYFKSEWSFAQFRLPVACHHTVAFGHQKNTVMILGMDGSFYQCEFDPVRGGEMTQLEHHNILKPEIASEKIL